MKCAKNSILFYFILPAAILIFTASGLRQSGSKLNSLPKPSANDKDTVWIFNGEDLSNLFVFISGKNKTNDNFYKIKEGSVYFSGDYKGYLRTKKNYSSFKLHAEWMWPEKGEQGNSGILVNLQRPDTVWPECIQINLKAGDAGDLIAMSGAKFREAEGKPKSTAVKLKKSSEKPEGMWNSCDIICGGDSMLVYINNVLQNKATGIIQHSGSIGWQLEGRPVALRNIYLIK